MGLGIVDIGVARSPRGLGIGCGRTGWRGDFRGRLRGCFPGCLRRRRRRRACGCGHGCCRAYRGGRGKRCCSGGRHRSHAALGFRGGLGFRDGLRFHDLRWRGSRLLGLHPRSLRRSPRLLGQRLLGAWCRRRRLLGARGTRQRTCGRRGPRVVGQWADHDVGVGDLDDRSVPRQRRGRERRRGRDGGAGGAGPGLRQLLLDVALEARRASSDSSSFSFSRPTLSEASRYTSCTAASRSSSINAKPLGTEEEANGTPTLIRSIGSRSEMTVMTRNRSRETPARNR